MKNNYKFFTKEEDQIIIDNYRSMGSAVADLLPERSKTSVMNRARRLGINISKEKELDGRSSTKSKSQEDSKSEKPKKTSRNTAWTKEEDYQIRKHGMEITESLMAALPDRSFAAIERRIQQLVNRKYVSSEPYTYVSYPLNAYVDIYGTYLGYDKAHSRFDEVIDRYLENIIKANPSKPRLADAMTKAFLMRYKDHLPPYDISRELNLTSEEAVDKLCTQCLTILKRTMPKRK